MVMQLVEEGQIELDSNLGAYLPNTTVGFNATIRNLLSHRAGIASYTNVPGFFDDVYSNPSYEYTPNDMLNYVVNDPVDTSGRFAYSNTHYILLGQLIEALDGGDLSASLQRRITDPLNLDSTSFVIRDAQRPESMVPAWSLPEFEGNFDRPYTSISSGAWAAGALASNVTDLETFLDALLDGTLVQPATLDQMRQFGPEGYGLGIFELNGDSGSVGIWHSGVIPGYNSIMAMTSDRETAVVVLSNNARMDVAAVADYLIEITAPQ